MNALHENRILREALQDLTVAVNAASVPFGTRAAYDKAMIALTDTDPHRKGLGVLTLTWEGAAMTLGERFASVGPTNYYDMTPTRWLEWMLSALPPENVK